MKVEDIIELERNGYNRAFLVTYQFASHAGSIMAFGQFPWTTKGRFPSGASLRESTANEIIEAFPQLENQPIAITFVNIQEISMNDLKDYYD